MTLRNNSLLAWPGYLLLFLMVAMPTTITLLYIKGFLFVLLVAFVAIRAFTRRSWAPKVVLWTLFIAIVTLLWGLRGLFLLAPGAFDRIKVDAVWPLVYLAIIGGIQNPRIFRGIQRTLLISGAFIAVFGLQLLLSVIGVVPKLPIESLFSQDQLASGLFYTVTFNDGFIGLATPGVNSLPFLVPFLMAALVIPGSRWISRRWAFVVLILNLLMALISARRAVQLVILLAPILILGLGLFYPKQERRPLMKSLGLMMAGATIFVIAAVFILPASGQLTPEGIADRFQAGFDFGASNTSDSAVGRIEQYHALLDGWTRSPLIGQGLGASAHRSIRMNEMPWSYELFYVDLLFQVGLLGCVAYLTAVIWLYWSAINIIKRGGPGASFMFPLLVGLSGMLIASASNPYLGGFETFWVFFLPLAFINYSLLHPPKFEATSVAAYQETKGSVR